MLQNRELPSATAIQPLSAVLSTAAPSPNTTVSGGGTLTVQGQTIAAQENQPLNNVVVATFTDTSPASAAQFSATIDWGDGSSSAGTVAANGAGGFNVAGSHTYLEEGNAITSITVTENQSASSASGTGSAVTADMPLTASAPSAPVQAVAGQTVTATVATFTDTAGLAEPVANYAASINWGDGTAATAGTIVLQSGSTFNVIGSHIYAVAGAYSAQVTIGHESAPAVTVASAVDVARHPGPTISLSVTYLRRREVLLSGQVSDADPGGLTVHFSGEVTGSVVTKADGTFSKKFETAALGTIEAVTTDRQGLQSNVATVTLTVSPPMIVDFVGTAGRGNVVIFTGKVVDPSAHDLVVTFGGLPSVQGKKAVVHKDGTFKLVVHLKRGEEGTVTAQTTDWWGQESNVAQWVIAA
jgi:hypothetical protein